MKQGALSLLAWNKRFSYLKNIPFDENDLHCTGARFQIVKFKPGTSIAPHYHKKTYEIFFVEKGNGVIAFNNKNIRTSPGDFFLCEAGDVHAFVNDTAEDFVILIFKTNEIEEDIFIGVES